MTRSIVFTTLLVVTVAACAQKPVESPPPVAAANAAVAGFVPYCGPVWWVERQGYVHIPCPPGSNYPGGQ